MWLLFRVSKIDFIVTLFENNRSPEASCGTRFVPARTAENIFRFHSQPREYCFAVGFINSFRTRDKIKTFVSNKHSNLELIGICGEKECCDASSLLSRILQCACSYDDPSSSFHAHDDPQQSDHGTHDACAQETRSS